MRDFVGLWQIVAAGQSFSVSPAVGESFDEEFPELALSSIESISPSTIVSGLAFHIWGTGRFSQCLFAPVSIDWFTVNGQPTNSFEPFDGKGHLRDGRLYLIPDNRPNTAIPRAGERQSMYRYDTRNKVACDFVEVQDRQLIRTVNVLIERTYFHRISLVFEPVLR